MAGSCFLRNREHLAHNESSRIELLMICKLSMSFCKSGLQSILPLILTDANDIAGLSACCRVVLSGIES
jgi:hypothetical protein